jgi:acetoin utilization protein AcuC
VSGTVGLVRCPDVHRYDHGQRHPLRPDRVRFTFDLIDALHLAEGPDVRDLEARIATDGEIGLVHEEAFIRATKDAGDGVPGSYARFGYGPGDNPVFPGMHGAAALVAGASLVGAAAVLRGEALHAFSPAGGLHHAMPARASGFCVYDDPAIAIAWLLREGAARVAYLDLDVHHGDGPQAVFWREPRVLTVSIHESGRTLFPGTGGLDERGAGAATGTKVNVPLPWGTGDGPWLRAIREVAAPAIRAFAPDVLVTQLGCDTHHLDPLAHLRITRNAYREAARLVHDLAHEVAGGRWFATGGGGYERVRAVPLAWTIWFAGMRGIELPDEVPAAWRDAVRAETGVVPPETFSEPPCEDAGVAADDAVHAARAALEAAPVR